ncbi:unnamed protein product [Larinioides sclopetarius]|uniref:Uncharacterized protein n=1 Tax=Larinioides sclopetarius TaxID=280406 RepID=A0AAV1Z7I4_9ARAC
MAVQRPDSGYSWVIVVCCAFIHFALFGLFRSGGVMYVAILQNYDVSREEASWPFALCAAVFQLVGPAVSIITHYISQRKACLLGCAIATIGIAACYFAESVMWIIVFYGVIHGLFRDVIGSYNWMFHFLGIISILFSVIWVVESWRSKERKSCNRVQDKKACDNKDVC